MGACVGSRNAYKSEMQKACINFENRLCLPYYDWKHLVAAINSYCHGDGAIPETTMNRIMSEIGLGTVYEDKTTHLKDFLNEYLKDYDSQRIWLIYLVLFMCGGNEPTKMDYLCWTINKMDMEKTTIPGEELKKILESLMKLSVIIIPQMGGFEFHKEEISKKPIEEAVTKWYNECNQETITIQDVRCWGIKSHNFTQIGRAHV